MTRVEQRARERPRWMVVVRSSKKTSLVNKPIPRRDTKKEKPDLPLHHPLRHRHHPKSSSSSVSSTSSLLYVRHVTRRQWRRQRYMRTKPVSVHHQPANLLRKRRKRTLRVFLLDVHFPNELGEEFLLQP
jgi:hypothetical protein